ncbi:MAG: hypothetical protein PHY34_06525 [Patescibacteria group bacterium]|nr:hypothetical protein [Patescibacteria group bacterium]
MEKSLVLTLVFASIALLFWRVFRIFTSKEPACSCGRPGGCGPDCQCDGKDHGAEKER